MCITITVAKWLCNLHNARWADSIHSPLDPHGPKGRRWKNKSIEIKTYGFQDAI